jgi:hypothetical protein
MSSTTTNAAGGGNNFAFNNENQNQKWPALSIIGVVVTVLGFIAVVWFIFWIFRREKRLRQRGRGDQCSPEPTNRECRNLARFCLKTERN